MPETSSYKGWTVEEPFLNLKCLLGEGPYFEKATNSLRFVDIKKKQLHTVPLESPRDTRTLQLDEPISATADIEGVDPARKIFVALKYGLAELNRLDGSYVYTHRFGGSKEEELRSNDGAVDPNGRFWVGTMTDFDMGQLRPEGSLYCLDQSTNRKLCDNLTIPNTIGWSPDLKTMYFTNTATRQVLAYDYSVSDGEVSNERVFYQHDGPGEPDGFRVDVDGNIWHAIYGEGRVLKISPRSQVVGEILLPTRNVTCTQFVGTELFITSAEDTDGDDKSKEFGGGLFRVDVGVEGLEPFPFKAGPHNKK